MSHQQQYFQAADALSLAENVWRPAVTHEATIVLVHGLAEHGGRYAHVARALNGRGMAVHAPDLRGHGRSRGDRLWVRSFDEYLDDVELYLQRVRASHPETPIFLLGHSMGGTIATLLAATRDVDVAGLILSAPALKIGDTVFPLLRRLAALMSRVLPRLRLVRLGSGRLSRDPENVARFREDPLVFHGRFPIRTCAEILRAVERVEVEAASMRLPLLILQGTGDVIVDPSGSREFHARSDSADKTLKLYDGLYHDLFGEPEREQVIADLLDWLTARVEAL